MKTDQMKYECSISPYEWSSDGQTKNVRNTFIILGYGDSRRILRQWLNMPLRLYMKYYWLIRLRECQEQLKHPREKVSIEFYNVTLELTPEEKKAHLQRRIAARKGILTKWKNIIQDFEKNWSELFPYEEDQGYIKAQAKFKISEEELQNLIRELENT